MKYSNEQIRGAILRAADAIEGGAPYNFNGLGTEVCEPCMWGRIGIELGIKEVNNLNIASAIGINNTSALYAFRHTKEATGIYMKRYDHRALAGYALRAFANQHFPAEVVKPVAEDRQLVRWDQCAWQPKAVA